jgi:hypothetical protein
MRIDKNLVPAVVRSGTSDSSRFLDQRGLLALALEYRLANRFFPELRRRLFDALASSRRKAVLSVDEGLVKVDLQRRRCPGSGATPSGSRAQAYRAHRRPRSGPAARLRLAAYREALKAARVPFDETLVHRGDFAVESGNKAMQALKQQRPRPTADLPCAQTSLAKHFLTFPCRRYFRVCNARASGSAISRRMSGLWSTSMIPAANARSRSCPPL